ncbi:MAG: hypothetical protein RRZ65_05450, partial [Tannerellaceae bacterium]
TSINCVILALSVPQYMKQQQDITEKKIVDQKSHVSHELTERQIDGSVKRGILILKYVLNKLTIFSSAIYKLVGNAEKGAE